MVRPSMVPTLTNAPCSGNGCSVVELDGPQSSLACTSTTDAIPMAFEICVAAPRNRNLPAPCYAVLCRGCSRQSGNARKSLAACRRACGGVNGLRQVTRRRPWPGGAAGAAGAEGRSRPTGAGRTGRTGRTAGRAGPPWSERARAPFRLPVEQLHIDVPRRRSFGQRLLRADQEPRDVSRRALGDMRCRGQPGERSTRRGRRRVTALAPPRAQAEGIGDRRRKGRHNPRLRP